MSRSFLFALSLGVILATAFGIYLANYTSNTTYKPGISKEVDSAVNQARHFYKVNKDGGVDLSHGPCLSDDLTSGWVADIVHNPRQEIDDLPENMCPSFISGKAKHFVELDLDGNLIRVK